jgi:hypothetical protein
VGDLRKPKPQRRRGLHSTGRTAALAFVAGALNAVVLARGLTVGGREDAMTALAPGSGRRLAKWSGFAAFVVRPDNPQLPA